MLKLRERLGASTPPEHARVVELPARTRRQAHACLPADEGARPPAAARPARPRGDGEPVAGAAARRAEPDRRAAAASRRTSSSTPRERRNLVRDIQHEMLGLGPLEPLLADPTVSDILVNGSQAGLRRAARPAEPDRRDLRRRRSPDEDHRQDRLARRPSRRRVEPDGRRPPARRLARQRDHPAARARRAGDVDPPLLGRAADDGRPRRAQDADAGDGAGAAGPGERRAQPADLRRHGQRQDDAAEHPVGLHRSGASGS